MQYLWAGILSLYSIFILYLIICVLKNRHRASSRTEIQLPVSIVIPFRNEQENITQLLQSLDSLCYSGDIEVILIDDSSTDNSCSVINSSIKSISLQVKILHSEYDQSKNLTSKQQALDLGIRTARNEWVALTDADMVFEPSWLSTLMSTAINHPDIALAFGHTSIYSPKTLFQHFQAFQLEFLFAIACSFHAAGITGSCMGNNLLLSKSKYLEVGGFDTIGYSIVEDRSLFTEFKKKRMSIAYVSPFTPSAYTEPSKTFSHFFQQSLRWATGGITYDSNLLYPTLLLMVQNGTLLLSPFLYPKFVSTLSIANFVVTWIFLAIVFRLIKSPINALFFPLYFTTLLIETLILGSFLPFRPRIKWKGRQV